MRKGSESSIGSAAMVLDECDRVRQSAAAQLGQVHAIVCIYTGAMPACCEPMLRDPSPPLGWPIEELASRLEQALRLNAAVEDGAVMFAREIVSISYRASGWSYRLFPPPSPVSVLANKGSAFNSCLLMSQVDNVDALYQPGDGHVWRFRKGGM